jgi:putative DNA primase/helicase
MRNTTVGKVAQAATQRKVTATAVHGGGAHVTNHVKNSAKAYLRNGWQPTPCVGKRPKFTGWQTLLLTENDLDSCFQEDDNIALLLGGISSDLVDVDLDAPQALAVANVFLPKTNRIHGRETKLRSHHWYKSSGLNQPKKFSDTDGTCLVEIRTDGQQTVVPPSIHPNGEAIRWECEGPPAVVDSAQLNRAVALTAVAALVARRWPKLGSRHEASLALHGHLIRCGFRGEEAARFVCAAAKAAGDEESASRAGDSRTTATRLEDGMPATGRKRLAELLGKSVVETMSTWLEINSTGANAHFRTMGRTDVANGRRLVVDHGPDIRFLHPRRKWLVFDGRRWREDDTGEIPRRAKQTVQKILAEAAAEPDEEVRSKLVAWQMTSEFEKRLKALVFVAESEPGIPVRVSDLDSDPQLFNCQNGTLDLRSGVLREHYRGDLITKISPIVYRADAECPHWLAFLNRIMYENPTLISFLRRIAGYSLTGETREHAFFLLYGTGANGKTTLLETLRHVWGDYAMTAEFSSFITSRSSGIRNDLARLAGARFVSAAEAQSNRYLAEEVVKQITGGDMITARFLYSEHFEFRPQFKLFLATNHKPGIRATDLAMWRRIHLVPFEVTIPTEEQDKQLLEKLRQEGAGILNWALEGLADWRQGGLAPPDMVTQATSEYRSQQDVMQQFIDERCVLDPGAEAAASELYEAYRVWCEASGERPICKRDFGLELKARGLQETRNAVRRGWAGIRLSKESE